MSHENLKILNNLSVLANEYSCIMHVVLWLKYLYSLFKIRPDENVFLQVICWSSYIKLKKINDIITYVIS